MTQKLYETDGNLFNASVKIIAIGKKEIRLLSENNQPYQQMCGFIETNSTIFHPQGGGQPADRGTINEVELLHVGLEKVEENEHILHYYDNKKYPHVENWRVGNSVIMQVDEKFRHHCCRYHSAGHLLAEIIERNPNYQVCAIKGNHFPNQACISFAFKAEHDPLFNILSQDPKEKQKIIEELQQQFDAKLKQKIPVTISFNQERRKISIGDSIMPCGGTHVENTIDLMGTKILEIVKEKKPPGFKIKYSCP